MARPAERNAKRKLLSVCRFSFRMAKNNRRWSLVPSDLRQPLGARGGRAAETARRLSYRVVEGGAPLWGAVAGAQSARPHSGRAAARAGGVSVASCQSARRQKIAALPPTALGGGRAAAAEGVRTVTRCEAFGGMSARPRDGQRGGKARPPTFLVTRKSHAQMVPGYFSIYTEIEQW